ncbi:MAG: glutathione S-transferase family protein [Halomonadaceae bacterium]|nr:MAG: glutathione S-transferase family protein [Halomonadaceae bacterium]
MENNTEENATRINRLKLPGQADHKTVLVSHHLCPYVQRSLIMLMEKGIAHTRINIDLGNKPDWFIALSPLGKVPLLVVNDHQVVFESAVICEYLDEVTPGSLHPTAPLERARHRAWIEFASQSLNGVARLYNAPDEIQFARATAAIREQFLRLEQEVTGPWFGGESFSIVDCAYGPLFRYFDVLDGYLAEDLLAPCSKVAAWRKGLAQRQTVREAVSQDYPQRLETFLGQRQSFLGEQVRSRWTGRNHQ